MKLIAVTLVSAAACLALSGCPSQTVKDGANAASKEPAAPGDINATDAQCRAERRLVETAVETYTILQGAPPVDEAAPAEPGKEAAAKPAVDPTAGAKQPVH